MAQVILLKGNATLCRCSAERTQVHEDGAAFAGHRWCVIVAQHHNQVVEMIGTPESLMAVRAG